MGYAIGQTDPSNYANVSNHSIALGLDIQQLVTGSALPLSASEGSILATPAERWTLLRRSGVLYSRVSSEVGGSGAYLVKDDISSHSEYWSVDVPSSTLPYTADYRLGESAKPTQMILQAASTGKSPKNFSLQYSNDGITWTTHQSWTNQTISSSPSGTLYTFLAPPSAYPWWRLNITATTATVSSTFNLVQFNLIDEFNYPLSTNPIWYYQLPGLSNTPPDRSFLYIRSHRKHNAFDNLIFYTGTGYSSNTMPMQQPGSYHMAKQLPLYSGPMPYWIHMNPQALIIHAKCNTVMRGGYAGKFFPFATPLQYPLPFVIAMPFAGEGDVVFDNTSLKNPFIGHSDNFGLLGPTNGTEILGSDLRLWPSDYTMGTSLNIYTRPFAPAKPVNRPSLSGVSVTATDTYTFSSPIDSYGLTIGMTVLFSGFTNSNNNGLKTVTALTSTTITVSGGLTVESAPSNISLTATDYALFPITIYSEGNGTDFNIFGNLDGVYKVAGSGHIVSEDIILVNGVKHIVFNYSGLIDDFFAAKLG